MIHHNRAALLGGWAVLLCGLAYLTPAVAEVCNPNVPSYSQPGCTEPGQTTSSYTPPTATTPYTPPSETTPYTPTTETTPYTAPTETTPYTPPTEITPFTLPEGPSWTPSSDTKTSPDTVESHSKEVTPAQKAIVMDGKAKKILSNVLKKSAIIILPEDRGKAWYVNPKTQERAYLGRPADAFKVMRSAGIGITNKDLLRIPESTEEGDVTYGCKHIGKIFLQVESKGEAWYVHPMNCKRYFLNRPSDAFELMRKLGLGVSNADAGKIPVNEKLDDPERPQDLASEESKETVEKKDDEKKPAIDTKQINQNTKQINDAIQRSIQNDAQNRVWNLFQNRYPSSSLRY